MKIILLTILVGLMLSCERPEDKYVKRFDRVDISKTTIPTMGYATDAMQIRAKAQAENGCWSKIYFEFRRTEPFNYTLKAYGTYESFGACPEILVTQDTVIDFQPMEKGTYLFHVSRSANEIDVDTLVVE